METQTAPTPESQLPASDMLTVIAPDGRADPRTDPKLDAAFLTRIYRTMVLTRIVDEQMVKLQRQGRIGFHIGSLGEEATVIGAAAATRPQDWIFPCYREFGALLWRGFPLQAYVDNMFGNIDDPVRGRQMPDHYASKVHHVASTSSPIGTQITHAAGFAWGAKIKKDDVVALPFLGEGATSSSDFHSGLNFAAVFKIPVVFLVRNNRWAISVPASRQTATATFSEKSVAYGMPGVRCDGNDVLASYSAVRDAIDRAAAGAGPTLIELVTYRLGGHSTSDDPKAYRPEADVEPWRKLDPLPRFRKYLSGRDLWTEGDENAWRAAVEQELKACVDLAEKKAPPSLDSMFEDVYGDLPWHLSEQQEALRAGPRARPYHG